MRQKNFRCLALSVFVLLLGNAAAWGESTHHSLWEVRGKHNTVYFFGSIHVLPPDEALPSDVDRAYTAAKKIIMEIDVNNIDSVASQSSIMTLGLMPEGQTLQSVLGPKNAALLADKTRELGIDATLLASFRPWFAAMTVNQLVLLKKGMTPQDGVEMRLAARANADHKEIVGLETMDEQLHLFADLPESQQTQFLMYTLTDLDKADQELNTMLAAWRNGDVATLAKLLDEDFQQFPSLQRTLTVDRNRRWMTRFEELLSDDRDYLVVVGTLHLVGKDGLVDLLEKRGYRVTQH